MAEPMLVVRLPDGASLSIEFTAQAPDDDHPGSAPGSNFAPRIQPPSCAPRSTRGCSRWSTRPSVLRHGARRPGLHHHPTALTKITPKCLNSTGRTRSQPCKTLPPILRHPRSAP